MRLPVPRPGILSTYGLDLGQPPRCIDALTWLVGGDLPCLLAARYGVGATVVRRLIRSRLVRVTFGLLAVGLLCFALVDQWPTVAPKFDRLSLWDTLGSGAAVLVGMYASLLSWRVLLAGLGSPLTVLAAGRIFFIGQIGKYVPGSVWPVLAQMELGADVGVPRASSAIALLFIYVLYTTSASLVAVSGLPWIVHAFPIWLAVLALVVGVTVLVPAVLNRLVRFGLRLLRRPASVQISGPAIIISFAWSLVMWVCFGLQIFLLSVDIGQESTWHLAVLAVGGYAVAWVAGFLTIVAPAGGGVREAVLTATLAATLGRPDAFAVALVSRALMTAGDLVCAVGAVASLGPVKLRALRERTKADRAALIEAQKETAHRHA